MHTTLSNNIQMLESQFQNSNLSAHQLEIQINESRRELEYYNYQCEMKNRELSALDSEIISKRNFIQNFDNEEGLVRIKEAAKQETELVLQNKRALLALSFSATLESFFQLLMPGPTDNYQDPWTESHKIQLVQLGEQIQSEITEEIIRKSLNELETPQPNVSSVADC